MKQNAYKETNYTSVTTWNHQHFPHFNADLVIKRMMNGKNWNPENKYWGKTAEEIKKEWSNNGSLVSGLGTTLHFNIECFMNEEIEYEDGSICENPEWDNGFQVAIALIKGAKDD
jgi:hypothetical protein